MRFINILVGGLLSLALSACNSVEIRPAEVSQFAAGNYQYYKWRSAPMQNTANSSDAIYLMDPIVRRQVNSGLRAKGYILDEAKAQFSVDYMFATGMRMGEKSQQASNLTPMPSITPNRQVDQASVDNAIALGGVKETSNIALQFNDVASNEEVWQVVMTKFVENANSIDTASLADNLGKAVKQALKPLPEAM